ncbi:hypothetical protein QE152_g7255 [Popillia japonica]|uniref:Uncharacterized protein n=1 Tax=Popillia japonica TaxID=7064 RepID=A0AAW1MFW4_POPJA
MQGRNLATNTVRQCVTCSRSNTKPTQPIMGQVPTFRIQPAPQVPTFRIQPAPPFNVTGVDYAIIKDRMGSGGKISKCYIGIFIYFTTTTRKMCLLRRLPAAYFPTIVLTSSAGIQS